MCDHPLSLPPPLILSSSHILLVLYAKLCSLQKGYPLAGVLLLLTSHAHLSFLAKKVTKFENESSISGSSKSGSVLLLMVEVILDEFNFNKIMSIVFISAACLSKGAATSFSGCLAVLEYMTYLTFMSNRKGTCCDASSKDKRNISHQVNFLNRNTWIAIVNAISHQVISLCVSLFVAHRTVQATSSQVNI
jgi:hypothetical protein